MTTQHRNRLAKKISQKWATVPKWFRTPARIILACVLTVLVLGGTIGTWYILSAERRIVEGSLEEWTEVPFYKLPNPIPAGKPGELVRSERLLGAPNGATGWRVLYHSTDVKGENILVSGVVVIPNSLAPKNGRPVIAWGHPTTGTAQRCAPSVGVDPFDLIEGLRDLIAAGYVVVATDYSGMGAAGPDSFLIGITEGNNMLDIARAARSMPATNANNELVLWGHSQGGHAALFAGQSAATYAPELQLKGVATAAPATNLAELLKADITDVSGVTIGSYAFDAYNKVYDAKLDAILTPAGVAATPQMAQLCLFEQNDELHKIATPLIGHYLQNDPASTQPWADLLEQNTPGSEKLAVPLFIAQGQTDTLVKPYITDQFAQKQTALGTKVTYDSIPDTGHGMVAFRAMPQLLTWLKQL